MGKYDGIEVAEVYSERVTYVTRKRTGGGALIRWIAAAAVLAVCFGIRLVDKPFADRAVGTIREAICYDMLGRETGDTVVDRWLDERET